VNTPLPDLLHDAVDGIEPADRIDEIRARTATSTRAAARPWFLARGGPPLALGAAAPRLLTLPYRGWMRFAELLSRVVTTLILAIVFFLVVTPIGLWKRLRGWDPLERRLAPQPAGASYWRPYSGRQADPKHFDKMY
jgi:hypothetical protein